MQITIYSTKTCPYCKMEKSYLDEKGVKYTNIFVDEDETKAEEMIHLSGQMGVPVTIIKDDTGKQEIAIGFNKNRLNKLLGLK